MRRFLFTMLAVPALVAGTITTPSVATASEGGRYQATVAYTCTSGCSGTYSHVYTISTYCNGVFSGSGTSTSPNAQGLAETINGGVSFITDTHLIDVHWTVVYLNFNPGYTVQGSGTIDPRTGVLTGTASDNAAQTFSVTGTLSGRLNNGCSLSPED